jgi:hypothetical protein
VSEKRAGKKAQHMMQRYTETAGGDEDSHIAYDL